jgi:hypothetical protein
VGRRNVFVVPVCRVRSRGYPDLTSSSLTHSKVGGIDV